VLFTGKESGKHLFTAKQSAKHLFTEKQSGKQKRVTGGKTRKQVSLVRREG
jgi:hypothetical protein